MTEASPESGGAEARSGPLHPGDAAAQDHPPSTEEPLLRVGRNATPPPRSARLLAVIRRHWVVYNSTFFANALPAFLEPILFLLAIGLGLGAYVENMAGLPMGAFMGPGALAMTAMFTASFETTYGTFVRLVYQKTYDGMLATPLTPDDVFLGEILWCGCKGFLFSGIVLLVYLVFGSFRGWLPHFQWATLWAVPLVGFCCSVMFAGLGLHMAAVTKNMNNFSFFFSGVLTPMSLFSGMVFPVSDLPVGLRQVAYALPLFHITELNRLLLFGSKACVEFVWVCPIYVAVGMVVLSRSGLRVMRRRIVE